MRRNKGLVLLALVALGAFTITATVAGSATASSSAVAAKKKCKKKARSAKKKKCKKKKGGATNTPLVRATLTWHDGGSSDVHMFLFAFDANGNRAGNGTDAIPDSTLSPTIAGPAGSQTFTDLAFNQKRPLSFGVCYDVGGSVHTPFTITYVTADGVTHTDSQNPGSTFHYEYPGGAPIPTNYCPIFA
jgi:hypothetical protein